ncbi:Gfo/Idh/MocA family protein [Fulvivirga sedimenti]|uniref:Gfo/Idh/MocA family oxidoreductase n=1 Tax=Fulvivirga sedimenti TaxID=2879465 RepID=A0A9X1HP67_9BACT|nr:Gfo/Idh/MocA family oxidoreductase [Fulvivirga sedimenti]MCA6075441.1 Gfo/Idh/MocA family oxidoreductase [Fulvivirga sedimenti]MCA6076618.1 Gfo/Idh/MocA family oxidoreductase [Fulvivirga sedimenti]MCA6077746.1 Gfo/Idh/MocA family oxidoreductase [Fulvivirga sedimenti]
MRRLLVIFALLISLTSYSQTEKPLRVAVVGLVHTHVHWILGREDRGDIEIVGIQESNTDLARRYSVQHNFSMDIVYSDLDTMLEEVKPDAVFAFNTIYDHLQVVEKCAPRGIHVMVEKPLAVSLDHAKQMEALAVKHNIWLLTNYETTWYGSNHAIFDLAVKENRLGDIRKMVIHDGHQGPEEIGVNKEFLEWLTDPHWNGAGALTDFGCYGANLSTWFMQGERPIEVFAFTQQMKPDKYPKVDDEATILVTYPGAQVIIQASWNWPFNRKDMEVYGAVGYAIADDGSNMRIRLPGDEKWQMHKAAPLNSPADDPFAYFAAVLNGEIQPEPYNPSSLENNMIVMEILQAAMNSAQSGKSIVLNKD